MNKFTEYLEMQIEGCKRTKAPYRDKIIYQLVLDEYKEQLTLTDVGKGTELLPDFLYKDDYGIKIGYHGDTEVSKEWNEYLEKIR